MNLVKAKQEKLIKDLRQEGFSVYEIYKTLRVDLADIYKVID